MGNEDSHDSGAKAAVVAALLGNLGVAVIKLVAWFFTHSAAMLAESLHSLADTVNQVFLLLGLKLGKRPPTEAHPFGFGRERYFWAFIVAVSIFTLGAAFSIYEGVKKMLHPHPIEDPTWAFVALGVAAVFESYALRIAWREFKEWRERNPGPFLRSLAESKSPTILVVLFEDSAALLGIVVACSGIALAMTTGNGLWDGLASLVIGIILLGAATFVGWRTRGLLLGEAATPADRARIRKAVAEVPEVVDILEVLTLHLGPTDILVNLNVKFADGLDTARLESAIDQIETRITESVPAARRIFIEAESLRGAKNA
jgi:cation diffusion facilitator family transporter